MSNQKPVFHHLNNSQSQRILWLLEELAIPYELVLHERYESGPKKLRAPDSMKNKDSLGKAPQLITTDGRTIIESSAIAYYLIKTYDHTNKFKGDSTTGNDDLRDEILTSFAGTSLGPVMIIEQLFDTIVKNTPFFLRWLFQGLRSQIQKVFTSAELDKMYTYLNDQLGEQDYFMGINPGRPDFMLSWPIDFCVQLKYVDLAKYPKVSAWHQRIHARGAWKESLNKGNGYDLRTLLG